METSQIIPYDAILRTIAVMREYKDLPKKCKLVIINTKKINNSWKKTKDYIGKFDAIKYCSAKQKFLNSKKRYNRIASFCSSIHLYRRWRQHRFLQWSQ
jgi:hypothetical protein